MRRLWDISIRSPSRETSQRDLRDISKKMSFLRRLWDISNTSQKRPLSCDILETSQMHLKKDVFLDTFLRRLKYISKKTSFTWRLEYISKKMSFMWRFEDVSKHYCKVPNNRAPPLIIFGKIFFEKFRVILIDLSRYLGMLLTSRGLQLIKSLMVSRCLPVMFTLAESSTDYSIFLTSQQS